MTDLSKLSLDELEDLKKSKTLQMQKHDLTQKTMKVGLNSLYGCMGNQYFIFYETAMAEAITLSGQFVIRKCADDMNNWLQGISGSNEDMRIYGDTDSVFFNYKPIVEKFMPDKTVEEQTDKIVEFADNQGNAKIKQLLEEACETMNAYNPDALNMERESVCDAAVFVAKKKYCLSIVDDEGNRLVKKKQKVTGLESKKATLSKEIRDKLKESYLCVLYNEEKDMIEMVNNFKEEFMDWDVDKMAQVTGVNNIEKFINLNMKGAPAHVKAAVSHNNYIKKKGIEKFVSPIVSGSKIKLINLIMPNPTLMPVFAFEGSWKDLYDLDDYIDKNKQFKKSFIDPLKNLTDMINLSIEPKETYDLF